MKLPLPIVFALLTALFWGLYGPTLSNARDPAHSPFKPYVGVGLAYTVWGLLGGFLAMLWMHDNFSLTTEAGSKAAIWGFLAGTLGSFGALSLTFAMFAGGTAMPQVVMPVVFGGAVSVAAVSSVVLTWGSVRTSPWLWVGIAGMGICTIIIAYNTPHPHPKSKPAAAEGAEGGHAQRPSEATTGETAT